MQSLSTQLKDDYISLFENNEEYSDTVVKLKYDIYPDITYPMITIDEISNDDANQYHNDATGDPVSYLAYQIEINAEQNENYTALENVDNIGNIIDDFMKGDKYKAMRRVGSFIKVPRSSDDNVMVGVMRYECYVNKDDNTIYRRY